MPADTRKLAAVILAAGKGKRMASDLPKVLHKLGDRALIRWVITAAEAVDAEPILVVVGHGRKRVMAELADTEASFVVQKKQQGTAHAVEQCRPYLQEYTGDLLILSGDVPFIKPETIRALHRRHQDAGAGATLMTADLDDPTGYGRIIRSADGNLKKIVEHKDASPEELEIREINAGIYIFEAQLLLHYLPLVGNDNTQGEYYLPDVLVHLLKQNHTVAVEKAGNIREILGVNTKEQLHELHAYV